MRQDAFYEQAWRPALVAAGSPQTATRFHSLSQWCGFSMLAAGAPITAVAGHLGDTVETISRTYAHCLRDDREIPAAVLDGLGLDEAARARVRSPAGLDLGPSSQEEIAVAILAELVAWRHTRSQDVLVEYATDPVCGMSVAIAGAQHTLEHDGMTYYFCGAHCRRKFEAALV